MTQMMKTLAIGGLAVSALALTACETVADAVVESRYDARLTGGTEVPGPGDSDGSGMAEITLVDATDQICFELNTRNIGVPTAAHIHRGGPGVAGPPIVTLQVSADGSSEGCVASDEATMNAIAAQPSNHYVNVHTAEFPNGAVRGQLIP